MTTNNWTKLTGVLNDVLSDSSLDKNKVKKVMDNWNSKKDDVNKLFSNGSKSGKTKKVKDENAPRKWKSSYIFFCSDKRESVKKSNPDLSATEMTKKLGEMWRSLSDEKKKKYEEMSKKDKVRYESEMESYVPPEGVTVEKKKKKERDGPKRPMSAYLYFCKDEREKIKEEHPDMKAKDVTSEMGARWKKLTAAQKAPYEELQKADKERYENEKGTSEVSKDNGRVARSKAPVKEAEKAPAKGKAAPAKAKETAKAPAKAKEAPAKASKAAPAKALAKGQSEGYTIFANEQREELRSENPDWSDKKIEAEIQKRWKKLSDDDRAAYEDNGDDETLSDDDSSDDE